MLIETDAAEADELEAANDELAEVAAEESELTPESESQDAGADPDSFDAAALEESFGLPAGTLKDAKDQESALVAVREYTDRMLLEGLNAPKETKETKTVKPKTTDTVAQVTKTAAEESEIVKLRKELDELRGTITKAQEERQSQMEAELDRRIETEIDKWASPKYGVGKNRTFNQAKAKNSLKELLTTHLKGYQARGVNPPVIEQVMRQVRAFDDDTYVPAKPKKSGNAMGTPGTGKRPVGPKEPANIHQAYIASR